LNLAVTIGETFTTLESTINKRNELIVLFRGDPFYKANTMPLYFGLPLPGGAQDNSFPDTIEALYSLLDSLIFFSIQLSRDLKVHGDKLVSQFKRKPGKIPLKITELDFA